ncbi:MAG: putative metal-binding motif-containing protein, partial [Deltaproteobacteria bacterium]|nr:putative metal-binding motif-containing protein [Deltaproteobacteria bacterium]
PSCGGTPPYDVGKIGDCNDKDPDAWPGAVEKCDGHDDDCDGQVDEDGATGCTIYYLDSDRDGQGTAASSKCKCGPGAPYDAIGTGDCADTNPDIHSGAPEYCNGADDDCDGGVDEPDSADCSPWYLDNDGDGFGQTGKTRCMCGASGNYRAAAGGDCNDALKSVYPGAPEICNQGQDDNCDGKNDDEGANGCQWYLYDADQDGFGVTGDARCLCAPTGSWSAYAGGDCNDKDATVRPGMPERCNGKDDNCQNGTDEEGATGCSAFYLDSDGDGFGTPVSKCLCAAATPYSATKSGDCNDANAAINPGATEACNLLDDDCDNAIDEQDAIGCSVFYADRDADTYGATGTGRCLCNKEGSYTATIAGDCDDLDNAVKPGQAEKCNGKDDDCDAVTDEERASGTCGTDGYATFWYDEDGDSYGKPGSSKCLCAASGWYAATRADDCNDGDPAVNPSGTERCNAKDDDCDGSVDEARLTGACGQDGYLFWYPDVDLDGYGADTDLKCMCAASGTYRATTPGDCNDGNAAIK